MSRWDESYEDRREREREERRKFEGDVYYDAWRRGLNPDRAVDCAEDCYYNGRTPEQCVDGLAQQEREARNRRQEKEQLEQQRYEYEQQMASEQEIAEAEQLRQSAAEQPSKETK